MSQHGPLSRLSVLLCLVLPAFPCHAQSRDLDRLNRRIEQVSAEMRRLLGEKQAQEKKLADLEKEIGRIALELRRLKEKIRHYRRQSRQLAQALKRQQQSLQRQRRQLASLLRTAYALGRRPSLQLLLNLDDPAAAGRVLTYYRYFNQAQIKRIEAVRRRLADIRRLQRQIDTARQRLDRLAAQQRQRLVQLQTTRKQRRQLLEEIRGRLQDRQSQLAKLRQDQQRLQRLLQAVERKNRANQESESRSFPARRHELPWPVAGRLVTDFGSRRGTGRWEGVVIRAPEDTPVKAVHPGRVIFSGWMPGYGQLLIVRHDHHFMTLYAFNQTLLKTVGERVEEGEVIATVGRSGGRERPGLYFAIRQGTRPVDPKQWCRPPRRGRVK